MRRLHLGSDASLRTVFVTGAVVLFLCIGSYSLAVDLVGTVHFAGSVSFEDPNIGLVPGDLTVGIKPDIAAGGGVKCELDVGTLASDIPDPNGLFPDAGDVSAQITMSKGGGIPADATCVVTVRASGTDGSSISGRGATSVVVDPNDLATSGTITGVNIVVRETKPIAGITKDCWKWMKKQQKKRAKCNFLILKKGGAAVADKCKDACSPDPGPCEPADPEVCDPGNYIEAALAFSHDSNDQQTDVPSGKAVTDYAAFKDQVKCQKHLGFAAANYLKKRNKLVQKKCIDEGIDSEDCRAQQSQDSKKTLRRIERCVGQQTSDAAVGLFAIPDVMAPCDECFVPYETLDAKCMKSCFESVLDEYSDLILGDVPECGNGIKQPPETCDDNNTTPGDGCDEFCQTEIP